MGTPQFLPFGGRASYMKGTVASSDCGSICLGISTVCGYIFSPLAKQSKCIYPQTSLLNVHKCILLCTLGLLTLIVWRHNSPCRYVYVYIHVYMLLVHMLHVHTHVIGGNFHLYIMCMFLATYMYMHVCACV